MTHRRRHLLAAIAMAIALGGCITGLPDGRSAPGDWPTYGNDAGGTRYSPLTQIDRANVGRLRVAWTYRTGENAGYGWANERVAFEATPIVVDGTLYLSTPFGRVIALDPETGAERWTYDPDVDRSRIFALVTSRGVSTWLDAAAEPGRACRRRIFVGTIDARLIALDAATGAPCADFGRGGEVNLTDGITVLHDCVCYQVTSPPAIVNGLVVIGSTIGDNRAVEIERGVVRAYDARTGALRWTWDPVPTRASDPAAATWKAESWRRNGAANVWSVMSVDVERGLVFAPTSSPSPDYYGGERLGANAYANSVVALRAATGEVVWHFQVVHHDLWDYDVPAQPSLVTVVRDGRRVPAVVVGTKMGHVFVLHRETGAPLFPVEERAVPKSTVPGEDAWPTQPFPVRPRPLAAARLTPDDAWGSTPAERDACRERIKSLRSEGIFTPPSFEGTIVLPGIGGGTNWGSLSHDPVRGLVIANVSHVPFVITLIPREQLQREWADIPARVRRQYSPQRGTPYAVRVQLLLSPGGAFCNPPPWGTLAAVDLASGDVRWEVPLGTTPELSAVAEARHWGSPNAGGALAFVAAARDTALRAFDVETGAPLWQAELPASAQATPMTYRSASGKQLVVIAAGGHAVMETKRGSRRRLRAAVARCIVGAVPRRRRLQVRQLTSAPVIIAVVSAGAGERTSDMNAYPLLIEFVSGTRITREPEVVSQLPILQNGPPGTSIVFSNGDAVPLPTDQIVFAEDGGGAAHVGFGGMSFTGIEGGELVFVRVRDLQPEELLSPQRGRRMTLEPRMVASIAVDGRVAWSQ